MRVSSPESVLEHSMKQSILTMMMYDLEAKSGNPHCLDLLHGPTRAITHDLDEIIDGDVMIHEKNKSKGIALQKARDNFRKVLDLGVPEEVRSSILPPHDLDDSSSQTEQEFWAACESIGYGLFALEEVRVALRSAYTPAFDESIVIEWDSVIYYALSCTYETAKKFRAVRVFRQGILIERERIVPNDLIIGNDAEHDRVRDSILARK
jgi:5'-deoxynucleotidase YfbR-like HD superfamily hydrolase